MQAAALNAALRVAMEEHAWRTADVRDGAADGPAERPADGLDAVVRRALRAVTEGLPR